MKVQEMKHNLDNWKLRKEFSYSTEKIRYDIEGDWPPLVLVHGTPWSSYNWRHIILASANWWTVYYYDLLGYGQSEKYPDQDVSLGIQNKVLAALLDHWELKSPFVVGHDFGGTTVLRTHLLENRDFRKIILIDPVAIGPWGSAFFQHVKENQSTFVDLPDYIHEAILLAYVRGASYHPLTNETLSDIIKPWLNESGKSAFYRQITQADHRFTDEIESMYASITRPVLILWGEQDEWIPISKGRKLHRSIPSSKFVTIPNAGLLVQEDAPALVVFHIIKFIIE